MRMTQADVERHNARVAKRTTTPLTDAAHCAASERQLHDEIESELKRRGWFYAHSRMDLPTTQALGIPDFQIAAPDGLTYWIEAKGPKTKVTPEQAGALHWLQRLGHKTGIVRSIEEFISIIDA